MDWLPFIAFTAVLLTVTPAQGAIYGRDKLKCPTRLLNGGRVRIKSKGRVAKYVCLRGYQVLGDKYSTCVRGRWDTPVPVCISPGCIEIDVPHGQVLATYRGAFVTVHCDPGYSLIGTRNIYCNGAVWNDTAPVCREIQVQAQKWCDFESEDLCGWTHDLNHDFDWRRHNFATPSGHVGTGPSFDHTFGPGLNGHYMYLETSSPRLQNDTARLFSPVFTAPANPISCFTFWYHMYGSTTGSLNVYLHSQETVLLFKLSGDQGDQWKEAVVTLPQTNSSFQIVIEGVRGLGFEGDTAIDDTRLVEGEECFSATSVTSSTEESSQATNDASCEDRCFTSTADPSLCECTVDCVSNNTCCPDYMQKCFPLSPASRFPLSQTGNEDTKMNHISSTPMTLPTNPVGKTTRNPATTEPGITISKTTLLNKLQISEGTSEMLINQLNSTSSKTNKPLLNVTGKSLSASHSSTTEILKYKNQFTLSEEKMFQNMKTSSTFTTLPYQTFPSPRTVSKSPIVPVLDVNQAISPSVPVTALKTSKTFTLKPIDQGLVTKKISWYTTTLPINQTRHKSSTVPYQVTLHPPIPTKISSDSSSQGKIKLVFKTPPPPVMFWTRKTTPSQKVTNFSQGGSASVPYTTLTRKVSKNLTKTAAKSRNDVLNPVWNTVTESNYFSRTHSPGLRFTSGPSAQSTLLPTTTRMSQISSTDANIPSSNSEIKWKSIYKPKFGTKDESPVHAPFDGSSLSNHMVHIIALVCVVLLSAVLVTVCVVRRRKINRRSIEDDELDIRFLASDEILDFTLARPSPDDAQEKL